MIDKDKIKKVSYIGQKKCRKLSEFGGKDNERQSK